MGERIQSRCVRGRRLVVEFIRSQDRLGHVLLVVEGDSVRGVLTSVEGTAEETWPASPPLQNLHLEHRPNPAGHSSEARQVALLVGMAGRSHWSLSVEPDVAVAAVEFDVACRVSAAGAANLGSTYRSELPVSRATTERCDLPLGDGWSLAVCVGAEPPARLEVSLGGLLRVLPAAMQPATRRWKYRFELVMDS